METPSIKSTSIRLILGVLLLLSATLLIAAYLQGEFPAFEVEESIASNLAFFLLINLNIIVVMVLGFLVVKNIIKLVLDRRRNMLGARLRSRLIIAFVGLSLIPTVLLFMVARGILERVLQGWFSPQIEASVEGALNVARYHYDAEEAQVYRNIHHLAGRLERILPYTDVSARGEEGYRRLLASYLEEKREEYGLIELSLVDRAGAVIASASSLEASRGVVELAGLNQASLFRAIRGEIVVHPEQSFNGEYLRGYAPVSTGPLSGIAGGLGEKNASRAIVATIWILPELSNALAAVVNAHDDYKELRTYRRPLASSYLLTLVVVTLLIVFGAIWVGFYLAKGLTVPIGLLATGTEQVAHGNLDHLIPELGDDELSILVRSFNKMTKDLKETTGELVARRRYMETILASVGVGVISIDTEGRITTVNAAAGGILEADRSPAALGKPLDQVFSPSVCREVNQLLNQLFSSNERALSANISLETKSGPKHLQLTITKLIDEKGERRGAVILLDDISELVSAQRMAAWREVARRIAHEIKNPLTPIQLCAERIQRKQLGSLGEEGEQRVIKDSTEMIIKQVENLRNLVNEFSRFARMPKSNLVQGDLNNTVIESISMYKDAHPAIRFHFDLDFSLPFFPLDSEQLGRALINLVDNSVASLIASETENPEIRISTRYDSVLGLASLTVADNGPGVADEDKPKLFEPYFSKKRGGTGLGLTIVSAIISDHNGFIRVRDNEPRGALFLIELPVTARKAVGAR